MRGRKREGPLRRVVDRAAKQRAPAGRDGQHAGESGTHHFHRRERTASSEGARTHALGSAGRARGVKHRAAQRLIVRLCCGALREEALVAVIGAANDYQLIEPRGARHILELPLDEHQLRARVLHDVGELLGTEVPVHGHADEPTVRRGEQNFEVLPAIARKYCDRVACRDALLAQRVDQLIDASVERLPGRRAELVGERGSRPPASASCFSG